MKIPVATEQTFCLGCAPATDDAHAPAGKEPEHGDDPSRARRGPRADGVVRWKPTRDHLGVGATPGDAARGGSRGGRGLSPRHRPTEAVRRRGAAGAGWAPAPAPRP